MRKAESIYTWMLVQRDNKSPTKKRRKEGGRKERNRRKGKGKGRNGKERKTKEEKRKKVILL